MALFKKFCNIIGILLLLVTIFCILEMVYFTVYSAGREMVIWMILGLLTGFIGLILVYAGSEE